MAVYEDREVRERAMKLYHHMVARFDEEISFSCTWWKFRYLLDPDIAMVGRHYASSADILVFATNSTGLFPLSVMNWIESWVEARRKGTGVLVPLIGSPNIPQKLYATKLFYLRQIAERAGLDYLPQSILWEPHTAVDPLANLSRTATRAGLNP